MDDTTMDVLSALAVHRGDATPADLTHLVGRSEGTVRRHLSKLVESDLASVFDYANGAHYCVSDKGRAVATGIA